MAFSVQVEKFPHQTKILQVSVPEIGRFYFEDSKRRFLGNWELRPPPEDGGDYPKIKEAAHLIRNTDIPVAFPTETVYGLGADATRSSAVRGIFKAKQRPSDNPLIVHISSLPQLRQLFLPKEVAGRSADPLPPIYHPLIERFWPGPLTVLIKLPDPSPFAPEVTALLPTVGVRMPNSRLALALIKEAGVPLAAPSANASTKPSPTTASHVLHDLDRRIDLILDGGPCDVGVESTVVDGLSDPPSILRPGGVTIEMLRLCPGWEHVQIGYKDKAQTGDQPRAPGMKYKHYSPKARVLLFTGPIDLAMLRQLAGEEDTVGVLTTTSKGVADIIPTLEGVTGVNSKINGEAGHDESLLTAKGHLLACESRSKTPTMVWYMKLGPSIEDVARGLFSSLRELDGKGVHTILVESVDERKGDTATAVMNRLRKAADDEIAPGST